MLKINANFNADNFICDNIEWVPLDTDDSIIAKKYLESELYDNEYNASVLESSPVNHKLVINGIYVFEKNAQKMFKRVLLIITPESSKSDKWIYESAVVDVEGAFIQDMDTSPSYDQSDALKEAWEEGYYFALDRLEDPDTLYCYLASRMIDYKDIQSKNPTKTTFEQWLVENIGETPDSSIIDFEQFAEPESLACPARDKYYQHLEWGDIESAFYGGGFQALEDYFKEHPIPKQEEWQEEYEEMLNQ